MRYGRHGSAMRITSRGRRHLLEAVGDLDRAADAEVAGGEHVGAAELEHQVHVGAPLAEPLDRDQLGDHGVVVELVEALELE